MVVRIGLLTAQSRNSDGELLAGTMLAGRSLLEWQVDIARRLGCERIICLSDNVSAELLTAQHFAETHTLEFITAKGPLQLTALVTVGHEVVVLQDGLWLDPSKLVENLTRSPAVASFSDKAGIDDQRQFERIDRDRLWAGFAIIPSRLVAKLADFPTDSDSVSLLLRLALQGKVPTVPIDQQQQISANWQLLGSLESADQLERSLMADQSSKTRWFGPMRYAASALTRRAIRSRLSLGNSLLAALVFILLMAGLTLVIRDLDGLGLAAATLGSFIAAIRSASRNHAVEILGEDKTMIDRLLGLARDLLVCAALCVVAAPFGQAVLPIFVIGLLVLAETQDRSIFADFWGDRTFQLVLLGIAFGFGRLELALAALGLVALAALLLKQLKPSNDGLTQA